MATTATHVWRPSTARTLTLDSFVAVPRGTTAVALPPLIWPIKDPADVLDYQFDISPALLGNDGDIISTLDISINPLTSPALTLSSSTSDGTLAILWLQGGLSGTTYTVTLLIGTLNNRIIQRDVQLPVLALSTPEVAANALITNTGAAVTDSSGNTLTTS